MIEDSTLPAMVDTAPRRVSTVAKLGLGRRPAAAESPPHLLSHQRRGAGARGGRSRVKSNEANLASGIRAC
jgi:hypothetical protein